MINAGTQTREHILITELDEDEQDEVKIWQKQRCCPLGNQQFNFWNVNQSLNWAAFPLKEQDHSWGEAASRPQG